MFLRSAFSVLSQKNAAISFEKRQKHRFPKLLAPSASAIVKPLELSESGGMHVVQLQTDTAKRLSPLLTISYR
jgi:hypothetical protein